MNKKALGYGLLAGAVIGGAAALLSAPLSGKEMRSRITNSKGEWLSIAKDLKENAADIKDSVAKLTKEGKEIFGELAGDVKLAIEEWQQDIEPNKEAMQQEMKEIQQTIANLEKQLQEKQAAGTH